MLTDPDIDHLLRATTESFTTVLHAVLDEDRHGAREVLKGSARRRRLVADARAAASTRRWAPPPQVAAELHFVADLAHLGELVDDLARHLVASSDRELRLTPSQHRDAALLLEAGRRRLARLVEGRRGPDAGAEDRGCGIALFAVVDHEAVDHSRTVTSCAELAATLLRATRHAA